MTWNRAVLQRLPSHESVAPTVIKLSSSKAPQPATLSLSLSESVAWPALEDEGITYPSLLTDPRLERDQYRVQKLGRNQCQVMSKIVMTSPFNKHNYHPKNPKGFSHEIVPTVKVTSRGHAAKREQARMQFSTAQQAKASRSLRNH